MLINSRLSCTSFSLFREQKELMVHLKRQMDEVRAKEEESIIIEQRQADLIEEQRALYQAVS